MMILEMKGLTKTCNNGIKGHTKTDNTGKKAPTKICMQQLLIVYLRGNIYNSLTVLEILKCLRNLR